MSFQHHGAGAICYAPCYYNEIRVPFRGPKRSLDGDYIACLGGAGMFGKFVPRALPDLLEAGTGVASINLGQVTGGVDLMLDPSVTAIAKRAVCTVVDLVGAHNLSNRFYRVHPRRNDRVITGTPLMRDVFPTLDLTEVHFTRHLLALMQDTSPSRMETVIEELQHVWLERMHALLDQLPGPVILLWMGGGSVPECANDPFCRVPFVDARMVAQIEDAASGLLVIEDGDWSLDEEGVGLPRRYRPQLKLLPSAREIAVAANQVIHRVTLDGLLAPACARAQAG